MNPNYIRKWQAKIVCSSIILALSVSAFGAGPKPAVDAIKTATPIKHVIIIVGENRSFDHLFATYVPQRKNERVLNLLSEATINATSSPAPTFPKAHHPKIL